MNEYACPKNCPDRSAVPNCHTTCERHQKYLEKVQERRDVRNALYEGRKKIQKPYLKRANIKKKEW